MKPSTLLDQPVEVVREMKLEPANLPAKVEPAALVSTSDVLTTFERLARDPSMDVDKLDRLMQMHERIVARDAEAQFNAAMADAQKAMRPVAADDWNPQTKSRYASYEALDEALRPIYTEHGFGLSFDTADAPRDEHVRIVCLVSHRGGHSRPYRIDMPADGKGAKGGDVMTKTHATGSAVSYGMRYLLKMIFNVAVGEGDDDGNAAGRRDPDAPDGFAAWWDVLQGVADSGLAELEDAWKKSKPEFKTHLAAVDRSAWNQLKIRAAKVKGAGR